MNQRIEGWRELERFTGMKEHRIRRAIGHYDFPRPTPEPFFRLCHDGLYRKSTTNIWIKAEVLIWLCLKNTIPTKDIQTNNKTTIKGDGYGIEQDQCNGDRSEPGRARAELTGVRG